MVQSAHFSKSYMYQVIENWGKVKGS